MSELIQMDLFTLTSSQEVILGDCLEVMKSYPDNHFTSIVTDPPYGLGFMGKKWDSKTPCEAYWLEAFRICKPGAMMLCFGGTRTFHRLTCAIEDAGWEIRDCLMWIYGGGFPKSHNHFGFEGYGTALKPAYEPIIMAMKPLDGTFKQNAEKHGVAGINIDECRIESNLKSKKRKASNEFGQSSNWNNHTNINTFYDASKGRWPANIMFDEEAAALLDQQTENTLHNSGKSTSGNHSKSIFKGFAGNDFGKRVDFEDDRTGASRFFYCAKASSSERNKGLKETGIKNESGRGFSQSDPYAKRMAYNNHPTVKPIKLMEYLLKLINPPSDGLILDPFLGSGTTLLAAKNLGINAVGIEKSEEYVNIAKERLK